MTHDREISTWLSTNSIFVGNLTKCKSIMNRAIIYLRCKSTSGQSTEKAKYSSILCEYRNWTLIRSLQTLFRMCLILSPPPIANYLGDLGGAKLAPNGLRILEKSSRALIPRGALIDRGRGGGGITHSKEG